MKKCLSTLMVIAMMTLPMITDLHVRPTQRSLAVDVPPVIIPPYKVTTGKTSTPVIIIKTDHYKKPIKLV